METQKQLMNIYESLNYFVKTILLMINLICVYKPRIQIQMWQLLEIDTNITNILIGWKKCKI